MTLTFAFPPLLERLALAYTMNQRPREAVMVLTVEQRLHYHYYPVTYTLWNEYAKRDPALFNEVVRNIPPLEATQARDKMTLARPTSQ